MNSIGIFVHETKAIPYATAIVEGYKTIETRTRNMLGKFVGQLVFVIKTSDNKPSEIVGWVRIKDAKYHTAEELDKMRDQTLIPPGSKFDCNGKGKWCYELSDPHKCDEPIPLSTLPCVRKTRSYVVFPFG